MLEAADSESTSNVAWSPSLCDCESIIYHSWNIFLYHEAGVIIQRPV
jgi:hypothetical protein